MVDAIILCGGKATRLRPVTQTIPKAMVKVNGKPIIDRQIEWLRSNGIENIILACGYKVKVLKAHLGNSVKYSVEDVSRPLGTLGAVQKALKLIKSKDVFVINGDIVSDIELKNLYRPQLLFPHLALAQYKCPYGVYVNGKFDEKPLLDVWINAGIYYFSEVVIKRLQTVKGSSIERDFFEKELLKVFKHKSFWVTIDSRKNLEDAEKIMGGY